MIYCSHDEDPNLCPVCVKAGEDVAAGDGPRALASFHGVCPACDDDIEPDEEIQLTDDGWVHVDCG